MTLPTHRIRAWGHETLPDLDYETSDRDDVRYKQYPFYIVALLVPVTKQAIDAAFKLELKR